MPLTLFSTTVFSTGPDGTGTILGSEWKVQEMPDLGTIYRKQLTDDGLGTFDETWFPIAFNVSCRLLKPSITTFNEKVEAGQEKAISKWEAYFPLGTDLIFTDRVVITTSVDQTSQPQFIPDVTQVFEVVELDTGLSKPVLITAQLIRLNRQSINF